MNKTITILLLALAGCGSTRDAAYDKGENISQDTAREGVRVLSEKVRRALGLGDREESSGSQSGQSSGGSSSKEPVGKAGSYVCQACGGEEYASGGSVPECCGEPMKASG